MFPLNFLTGSITKIFIAVFLVLIALIIVPNLGQIYNKLGFDTVSSMKEDVSKAEKARDTAINTAKQNDTTIDVLNKVDKIKDEVVINNIENTKVIDGKTTNRLKDKDKKIDEVKKKPASIDDKDITPELKLAVELSGESLEKVKISQVNIATIWDSYCEASTQCKDKV